MIAFNVPPYVGTELKYIEQAIKNRKISGDGKFTACCNEWLEEKTGAKKVLLSTSCTHALEMAALLAGIKEGDEIIMPSYTFVSTGDAFVVRGAKLVFVDIRPDTMNINERLIEAAITKRTKAIVVVHYAGVACEMDTIMDIAGRHKLFVIEDAAQGVLCTYKGAALGTIGDFGCYSFHETKNFSMGEGGALVLKSTAYVDDAEIIREKGTDRKKFFRGEVDKYQWVNWGSSYLPSELNAAYLWAQLEQADKISADRLLSYREYEEGLSDLQQSGKIDLPYVPAECQHNAHMFYIKCRDLEERTALLSFLKENGILAVFHYVPLHSSIAGRRFGVFHGEDIHTTAESERIVRLPMYYGLKKQDRDFVIDRIHAFYKKQA
ncbi:MAG: dTDP-4-amino-4,6-dideoxygalactose transaminase [Lachnospiraceae bacterium]|nr:dTDP-4-amino-4,6-dideoxygalactose transaminase [Lachnospiraceae bacterium]